MKLCRSDDIANPKDNKSAVYLSHEVQKVKAPDQVTGERRGAETFTSCRLQHCKKLLRGSSQIFFKWVKLWSIF